MNEGNLSHTLDSTIWYSASPSPSPSSLMEPSIEWRPCARYVHSAHSLVKKNEMRNSCELTNTDLDTILQ
ncbi:hypothetical protein BLOT_014766 [Blomia tropicalis]|nr:hypothetical protein BLOT_014766 [Blomia tropicalis]